MSYKEPDEWEWYNRWFPMLVSLWFALLLVVFSLLGHTPMLLVGIYSTVIVVGLLIQFDYERSVGVLAE